MPPPMWQPPDMTVPSYSTPPPVINYGGKISIIFLLFVLNPISVLCELILIYYNLKCWLQRVFEITSKNFYWMNLPLYYSGTKLFVLGIFK